MSKRITLYCASSPAIDPLFFEQGKAVGRLMASENFHLLYGGGATGLMGCIADSFLRTSNAITGIIPQFMIELEWQHPDVKDMITVDTMAQRKALLLKDSDGVLVLPGSIGTFEEVMETLSMKKLGLFFKPVIFLNTKNYFDPLFEMLKRAADENFMRQEHTQLYSIAETPEEAIDLLLHSSDLSDNARDMAAVV